MELTFDEAINRYVPARTELALIEPWVSGGTLTSGLFVSHHTDLPKVYGFIRRLHPDYTGTLREGDMVLFPRYAYEVISYGIEVMDFEEEPIPWELAAIQVDVLECVIDLELEEHPDELDPEVIRATTFTKSPEKSQEETRRRRV
jgi:hypothetical protein